MSEDEGETTLARLSNRFPEFVLSVTEHSTDAPVVEPAATSEMLASLVRDHGVLPPSLADFLLLSRGFEALDGSLKIGIRHFVQTSDGIAAGLVRFGEFFLEGDGDAVYFDPADRRGDGECPVVYLDHDTPALRVIAPDFEAWLHDTVKLLFDE